jgi:peroxiredoxin Q/BCP
MSKTSKGTAPMIFVLIVIAVILVATVGYRAVHAGDKAPAVGSTAPDFTLKSQENNPVSLHDFKGKWVVLYFYPKDFTPGCTIEAHGFQRDLAQYQAKNVEIVGVSVDSADSHKDFCAKEGLNFKLLSDADHQVVKTYGSVKTMGTNEIAARNTFIVDPKGKIVKVFLGVAPAKHSAEVLAALDDLQKGSAN